MLGCCVRRLNFRLANACHSTIASKCSDACGAINLEQPCGGKVLRCLTEKIEEIQDEECKKEVFYFEKMEVQDFRNDIMLAEACRMDVDSHCSNIQPGDWNWQDAEPMADLHGVAAHVGILVLGRVCIHCSSELIPGHGTRYAKGRTVVHAGSCSVAGCMQTVGVMWSSSCASDTLVLLAIG